MNDSLNWRRRYGVQSLWRLLVSSNWQQAEQQIFYISAPAFDLLKPTCTTRNAALFEKQLFELVPSQSLVLLRAPQTLAVVVRDIAAELPNDYAERLLIVADVPYLRKLRDLLKRTKSEQSSNALTNSLGMEKLHAMRLLLPQAASTFAIRYSAERQP